ncbi:MAG: hypothetical protein LH472_08460 [Pyrinomonadaceae bacterium]|nr:hypothetical protein [Pyrinomonadaceae bacterium]
MFSFLSFLGRGAVSPDSDNSKNSKKNSAEKSKFIGSPLFNVLLMVALMLGVSAFFRILEWRRLNAQTQIQINDSETVADRGNAKNKIASQPADVFGGEVFDTSRRLRETGALGFAVCLSILDEARSKRQIPGSIKALINAVTSRELLPPGLTVENGEIRSETSVIYIRYQPEPMQIEFVSVPAQARFGPTLLMRFPLVSADGKNIAYFQSSRIAGVNLPPPFAPASEVIRRGWTLEAWRGNEVGGGNQDFVRMLADEQENLKSTAANNDNERSR